MVSLLQLPQNIWREKIVYFLPKVKDLVRLDSAVVNHADRTTFLSNMSGCKRFYHFQKSGENIRWYTLRNMIVQCATFSAELQSEDCSSMPQLLVHAQCIDFLKCSVQSLETSWLCSDALLYLTFSNCEIMDLSAIAVCTNLVEMYLDNCDRVSTESFVVGIKGCLKLKCVQISECATLLDETVIVLLQTCVQLTVLILKGIYNLYTVFGHHHYKAALSLVYFSCTDSQSHLSGAALREVGIAMPQITALHIQYRSNSMRDGDLEHLVCSCSHLTSLQLHACTSLTNAALLHLAQRLPSLSTLYIDYCWSITDNGVISLAQFATSLRTLRLSGVSITNAAVQSIGLHCQMLSNLSVTNCVMLTDSAFVTLNMSQLHILDVSHTLVTGTFAAHVFSETSALHTFIGNPCEYLNADFVHSLPRHLPLTTLRLKTKRLKESEWLQVSTRFPNLRNLIIRDTTAVNDSVAQSFKKNCTCLRYVVMEGCSVTEEGLKLFA